MSKDKKLHKKIEKYERRLRRLQQKRRQTHSRSRSRSRSPLPDIPTMDIISDEDDINSEEIDNGQQQQVCVPSQLPHCSHVEPNEDIPNPVAAFRDALGLEYDDNKEKFVGNIQHEITTRWNHVLVHGLPKDEKENIQKKYKLPENCQLLEAPILNDEVKSAITESAKIRDRSLEMVQHQLGLATAIVGQAMTDLIQNKEIDKVQLVAKLTDASKLLNDIHCQKTKTRRLLISPLLDKNFNNLVEKAKRDEHLYGIDLAVKIKTSLELKKSSSQIKKTVPKPPLNKPSTNVKTMGNRYGPPQTQQNHQTRVTAPRGGPRNRITQQPSSRRPAFSQPRPERAAPRGAHSSRR